ncbi:MAG: MBOAT family O-acyltransferase [Pseudomonadota bacterium]
MLFNSLEFLAFYSLVVAVYFALPHRGRLWLLLLASYYFYASWKVEYALLILTSTLVDYAAGLAMGAAGDRRRRRAWLLLSLTVNLGLLFVFKYFNFVAGSLNELFALYGAGQHIRSLDLLLPVGISFYTFQTLSYTIDVYRGDRTPERSLLSFALYVSFFPQLVAGPIERSTRLLPQFLKPTEFDWSAVEKGFTLILWGFFLKLVIADQLAPYIDRIYGAPQAFSGGHLLLATYLFAFQIFGDFAGYSAIAIGTARILGYQLRDNFRRPYFSANLREFWTRWHISLSTWFRDYLYIPLGGSRRGELRCWMNLTVVFAISGVWHGANWTFIVWGLIHGVGVVLTRGWDRWRNSRSPGGPFGRGVKIFLTFHLVVLAWIFFRADSLSRGWYILTHLAELPEFSADYLASLILPFTGDYSAAAAFVTVVVFIGMMEAVHVIQETRYPAVMERWQQSGVFRGLCLIVLLNIILFFGRFDSQAFIYFQF